MDFFSKCFSARCALSFALLGMFFIGTGAAETTPLRHQTQSLTIAGRQVQAQVPQGYRLEFLGPLNTPRMLAFASDGALFIGSKAGIVYRLVPPYTTANKLIGIGGYPHSVAFRQGEILIAKTDGVYRAPYQNGQERLDSNAVKLLAALPDGWGHNSRTLSVGPDGRIYVSLGIQGNCSDQYLGQGYGFDDQRGGVLVLREDGKPHWLPYASGLRNPVGLAWQPKSNVLYASNNGPDHWGYDLPPEYFSRLTPDSFHGMPWFQSDGTRLKPDTCASSKPPRPASEVGLPVATFPARSAPMGVSFVPEGALDPALSGDAIVAVHGSWGTQPSGGPLGDPASRRPPRLAIVRFSGNNAQRVDDFVTGFQTANGDRWARPIGVAFGPDGALYFTSDSATEGLFRIRRMQ
jgi:glucose/arabinose dehydrogenase